MSMRRCSLLDLTVISFQILLLFGIFSCTLSFAQPFIDVCPTVNSLNLCGKGTCDQNLSSIEAFECKCDSGWKDVQILDFTFPTCALPNCSLGYQCGDGSPFQPMIDILDPSCPLCLGANCTAGDSPLNATCHCDEGYGNLQDNPHLPCFQKCFLNGRCDNGVATPSPTASGGSTKVTTLYFLILSATVLVTWF